MNKIIASATAAFLLTACTTKVMVSPTPIPTAEDLSLLQSPTPTTQITATPSATIQGKAIWETYEKQKNPDVAFAGYSIQYPKTWSKKVEENQAIADFMLTKESYQITIRQAGMGPGECNTDKYIEIDSVMGTLHRIKGYSPEKEFTNYSVCAKPENGNYMTPTSIGLISVKAPVPEDPSIMTEVDSILNTITEK